MSYGVQDITNSYLEPKDILEFSLILLHSLFLSLSPSSMYHSNKSSFVSSFLHFVLIWVTAWRQSIQGFVR